jgi:hypothetical protein
MSAHLSDAEQRLQFFKQLQVLANKIHATQDVDEIMLDLSPDLCQLFNGDRLTVYAVSEDKASMVSKVKTGLASFKQLKLPISAQSIAGYAALSRRLLNIADVYDEAELKRIDPELCFQQGVDRRTGYRTQQMLVAPILADNGEPLGVLQLINNHRGGPFGEMVEEGVQLLCDSMAVAFTARANAPQRDRSRFAAMISESVLSRSQLEAAQRSALARNADIEDVLLDEMGIKIGLVGRALADFFGVPYFTFQIDRRRPPGLLDNFNYEFVVQNQWMPIEEGRNGLFVLAVDPDRLKASGAVARIFPNAVPVYCVTTRREFGWMVSQFFGDGAVEATVPPASATPAAMPALPDVSQTIIANTVSHLVQGALREGITELHIETMPGKDATEVRFQVTGVIKLPPK